MGKNKSRSILGDYTGKISTVVLSSYRGTPTMRSLPAPSSKAASSKQLRQRDIFKIVGEICRPVKDIIKIGYQLPKKSAMSPLNAAASYHMKNCIGGTAANPHFEFANFRLSKPMRKTQQAWNAKVSAEGGNMINVNWELNPYPQKCAQLNDKVIIVFYNAKTHRFFSFRNACRRSDLAFSYTFNETCTGHDFFCYMFMVSADKKLVSETAYLGMVTIA
jgi:uncharacterized protein DUF6266